VQKHKLVQASFLCFDDVFYAVPLMSKVSYAWFNSINDGEISTAKAQSSAAMLFLTMHMF
jgi:hypothetical protein